jgi:hypothetical protein
MPRYLNHSSVIYRSLPSDDDVSSISLLGARRTTRFDASRLGFRPDIRETFAIVRRLTSHTHRKILALPKSNGFAQVLSSARGIVSRGPRVGNFGLTRRLSRQLSCVKCLYVRSMCTHDFPSTECNSHSPECSDYSVFAIFKYERVSAQACLMLSENVVPASV